MKVFIATHKKIDNYGDNSYQRIQVGAELSKEDFGDGYIKDNLGDNISDKNENYCELTALYWIWKNSELLADDIVGLEHYRRYLREPEGIFKPKNAVCNSTAKKLLSTYDMIVPQITHYAASIEYDYKTYHCERDFEILRQVIKDIEPEYVSTFEAFSKSHYGYKCNIFICKKELFDNYAKWLFHILFEVEKRVDISEYSNKQKRIFGYMSERLLNVWIIKNNLKVKELELVNNEQKFVDVLKMKIYWIARYIFRINIHQYQISRRFALYKGE